MKTNILKSYCIVLDQYLHSTYSLLDSLSIVSRQSVLAILVACLTVFGVGDAWGTKTAIYTFATAKSTSNTAYANTYDVTISSKSWNVPGNQNFSGHVRIGGQQLDAVDRIITGKSTIGDTITRIVINHGGISNANLKVNSITITSASNNTFTTNVTTKTISSPSVSASTNDSIIFTPTSPATFWAKDQYYKITINVTNSYKSNYGFDLKNIKFYKETFRTTYDKNGGSTGSGTTDGVAYVKGRTVTAKANGFTAPDGKEFSCWNTKADGTGTDIDAGATFAITQDTTLYAKWVSTASCDTDPSIGAASLSGTFNLGTVGVQCASITPGSNCSVASGDYGFIWYANDGTKKEIGGTGVTKVAVTSGAYSSGSFSASLTSTFVLGNRYSVRAFATNGKPATVYSDTITFQPRSVTFNLNGHGSSTPSTQYVNSGSKASDPSYSESVTGYTFGGWYKEVGCTNAWTFGTDEVSKDTVLYAKWTEKPKYTITLNAGNGTVSADGWTAGDSPTWSKKQANGDEAITFPEASCNCAGWNFVGWATSSATNAGSDPTSKAAGSTLTPASNVTYYAVYQQSTPGGTTYNKITSTGDLTTGEYVFASSGGYAMSKTVLGDGYMSEKSSFIGSSITVSADTLRWLIVKFGSQVLIRNKNNSKFLGIDKNGYITCDDNPHLWTFTYNTTNSRWEFTSATYTDYQLTYSKAAGTSYNYFCAGETQSTAIYLYKQGAVTGNYYTSPSCTDYTVTASADPVAGGTVYQSATSVASGGKIYVYCTIHKDYNFDGWTISGTDVSPTSASTQFVEITAGSANVTATANYDHKDWHVQWKVNGVELTGSDLGDAQNYYDNDEWASVLPPNPSSCDTGDGASDVFVGWTTNSWGGKSTEPAVLFKNGRDAPVINKDVTYHAVFAKESSTTYKRITSTKYIGLDSKIVIVNNSSEKTIKNDYSAVDVSSNLSADDATLSSVSSNWVWTAKSQDSDGYYILKNGSKQLGINKTGGMTSSYSACGDYSTVASAWDLWEASDTKEFNTTTSNCFYLWNWATASYYNFLTLYNGTTWESKYYANSSSKGNPTASENAMRLYIPEYTNYLISCCTAYDISLTGSGTVDGGTIEADPTSACEGAAVTLAATPSKGYNFTKWIVKDGSADDVTSSVIADGDEDDAYTEMTMPAYDVTVDATFTAKEYTIVLDKNGGTSDGEATATYNSSSLSSVTDASYTGYTLLGYYTEDSGGDMVITANGALVASVGDYTDKDAKWIYDDGATFSAHWKPTGTWDVTITAPSNGTITVTYNSGASSMTSGSAYIGGTVTISAEGDTHYELATNGLKVNGTTFTSGNSLTLSEDITISATFSLKKHNVAVTELSTVTISAGDIDEGENDDVNYGTELTLSYSSVTSGHYWSDWKVTNTGGEDVTEDVVSGSTLTVPDYDIIVTAKIYGDVKAWCIPTFNVTGDVHLTSTAGVYVNLTEDADNLINFSGSDLSSVSKITINYLDGNGDEVADKKDSPLRLYGTGGTSLAEDNINSFPEGAYNQDYSVRLTVPAATYNTEYNYKLLLKIYKGTRVIKTVEHPMNGRALPEEFVIAVKSGDQWYALPNNLASTSSQPSIVPQAITVNNTITPTEVTFAPTTVVYKATGRNAATKYMNGIRFTTIGSNYLQTAKANSAGNYNMWLSTSNSDSAQVWYLSSTDFGAYTLKMDAKHNGSKKMGIYTGGYIGFHGSPTASDIYLLPIGTKYTPVDVTDTDWTGCAIGVTATTDANKLGIKQKDGTVTSPVALFSSVSTSHVADFNSSINFTDLTGDTILLQWYKDESIIGGSEVTVPSIILAGAASTWSTLASTPTLNDIVVLSKPMTVNVSHAKAKKIVLDQSSTNTGKLTIQPSKGLEVASTVKVYSGTNFVATTEADLVLESSEDDGNASLIFNNSNACQATVQMYSKAAIDGNTWNWQYVGTPFTGSIPLYNYYGSWMYKWDKTDGWLVVHGGDELTPFAGYCLTQESATTHVMGGTLVATDGNDQVIDMGEETDMVLANSWTAPIWIGGFTEETFKSEPATIYLFNTGSAVDGSSAGTTEAGTYNTVPVNSGPYVGTELIPSMQGFFVTTNDEDGKAGKIKLKYDELVRPKGYHTSITTGQMYAPKRVNKPEVMKIMANGSKYSDRVVLLERADFSSGFDNGWDGEKLSFGVEGPSVYVINGQGKYDAVSAIPSFEGTVVGFRSGTDNSCTISFEYDGNETLYLNDLKMQQSTPIDTVHTYTFSTASSDNEARFIISATPITAVTTGFESSAVSGQSSEVRKVLIGSQIYIIRGGRMYSAEGQMVK